MAAINTLDHSVFSRFWGYRLVIGWLLAAHGPKSIQFKTLGSLNLCTGGVCHHVTGVGVPCLQMEHICTQPAQTKTEMKN